MTKNKVVKKANRIESVEAADSSWWIAARGGRTPPICADEEDLKSIVASGDVSVQNAPYPRRYVGYGAIQNVLLPGEIVGVDEATDQPIISEVAVQRLATEQTE